MSDLVLKGGVVLDATGERPADVVVGADGTILAIGSALTADRVLDATGCVVAPGFVDLFCAVGEPGRCEAETVESASRAAVLGGYTALVVRPDDDHPLDSAAAVRELRDVASVALCDVVAAGAVTLGRRGERLAPLGELAALGVRLFSDEGAGVTDPRLLRRALEYASDLGIVLAQPAEDARLGAGGYAHEGGWSSRLGLAAVAAEAEEIAVMRDLALVRQVGARLHFRRLSTAASLAMVRAARRAGLAVSADATLHHALLNDGALGGRLPPFAGWVAPAGLRPDEPDPARAYDPQFLFRPPLRPEADRAAVLACLEAADVDALVSDHTPVPAHLKEMPLDGAAAGAVGLETTPILAFSHLGVPLARLIPLLSWQPAALAGLGAAHGGELAAGRPANLVVIEPGAAGQIDPARFASRSRNTPWAGVHTTFAVRHTIARGRAVVIEGEAQC